MDTVIRSQDHQLTSPGSTEPASSEAAANMSCAFMASEEFALFVLACVAQAARDAVAEQAELTARTRRDE